MRITIPLLLILLSCNVEKDVDITEIKQNKEIIIFPSYKRDSVEILVPYTFRITNKDINEVRFSRFRYKPDKMSVEPDLFVEEDNTLTKGLSAQSKFISAYGSKNYTFYLKTFENKKKIDEKYWKQFPREWNDYRDLIKLKFNRVLAGTNDYTFLKMKIENDSLAFTFEYGEYMVIKVCKLNEYKFNTTNTDDILAHPENIYDSTFKPKK